MGYILRDVTEEQVEDIESRLSAFDEKHISFKLPDRVSVGVFLKDELIAGADGCMTAYRIFYISTVFVDEAHRGMGVGRKLMEAVEVRAALLGANMIRLDTFDWQGAAFYRKLGYEQVGCYENTKDGFSEYFFLKRI